MAGRVVRLDPVAGPDPTPPASGAARPPTREQRIGEAARACIAAHLVAFVCGLVGADYVGSSYFSVILPALSGLACAWLVTRSAPSLPQLTRNAIAGGYGASSAAIAFVYSDTPYGSLGTWLPPLLAGVVGAVLWPLLDPAPPAVSGRR